MSQERLTRWKLAEIGKQGGKCPLCQQPYSKKRPPTIDHIVPKSLGGGLASDNRRVICRVCNNRKANHPIWNPNQPDQTDAPPGMPLPPPLPEFSFPPLLPVQRGTSHRPPQPLPSDRWKTIAQLETAVNSLKAGKDVHICKYDLRYNIKDLISALPLLIELKATWSGPNGLQFLFPGGYLLNWWPSKGTLLWQKKLPKGADNIGERRRTLADELRGRKAELMAAKGTPGTSSDARFDASSTPWSAAPKKKCEKCDGLGWKRIVFEGVSGMQGCDKCGGIGEEPA